MSLSLLGQSDFGDWTRLIIIALVIGGSILANAVKSYAERRREEIDAEADESPSTPPVEPRRRVPGDELQTAKPMPPRPARRVTSEYSPATTVPAPPRRTRRVQTSPGPQSGGEFGRRGPSPGPDRGAVPQSAASRQQPRAPTRSSPPPQPARRAATAPLPTPSGEIARQERQKADQIKSRIGNTQDIYAAPIDEKEIDVLVEDVEIGAEPVRVAWVNLDSMRQGVIFSEILAKSVSMREEF